MVVLSSVERFGTYSADAARGGVAHATTADTARNPSWMKYVLEIHDQQ